MTGIVLSVAIGAAVLYGLHRMMIGMEARGWIRYRTKGRVGGAAGNALAELHAMLEPERRHTLEVKREAERPRPDRFGDPPTSETDGGKRDER